MRWHIAPLTDQEEGGGFHCNRNLTFSTNEERRVMGYIRAEGIRLIPKVSNLLVNLRNRRSNCNFVL